MYFHCSAKFEASQLFSLGEQNLRRRGAIYISAASSQQFYIEDVCEGIGGAKLHPLELSLEMFGADEMLAVSIPLQDMKVKQLAEELVARGVAKSGLKRALQLRLRALMIAAALEVTAENE